MAKYLRVNPDYDDGELTGMNWRLPATADFGEIEAQIAGAMGGDNVFSVLVEMGDTPLQNSRLILNGKHLKSVLLSQTPEPDDL